VRRARAARRSPSPSGLRSRSVGLVLLAGAAIPLPTPATPLTRTDPLTLLGPGRPGELPSHAPGPVADDEVVHVGLAPDGAVKSVTVDQQLSLSGVGDFEVRVLGPVTDVVGAAGASPQPGLRLGTVIWQGFSPGAKVLRSTMTLDPATERDRLPVRVGPGPVLMNAAAVPVQLAQGTPDPAALRSLVAAVRAALAAGQAPVPGAGGIPASLPSSGPVTLARRTVYAPLRVVGSGIDTVLTDATPVRIPANASFTVTTALPDPSALPADAGLEAVEVVLAQVAHRDDVDAYMGATVPGSSTTRYEYGPAAAPAAAPNGPATTPDRAHPGTIVLCLLVAMALAAEARAVWVRS